MADVAAELAEARQADAILRLFIDTLLPRADYINRVKRHYQLFRATVDRTPNPLLRRRDIDGCLAPATIEQQVIDGQARRAVDLSQNAAALHEIAVGIDKAGILKTLVAA